MTRNQITDAANTSGIKTARYQQQRLAVAAGMTLADGSPVVVGGSLCPAASKIKAAISFVAKRMTRDQFESRREDHGCVRPYFAATHKGGDAVGVILGEWSGLSDDCDGEMDMETSLSIS